MTPTVPDFSRMRCHLHGDREAVARCRECGDYFCRECIIEHEGRMCCQRCIQVLVQTKPERKSANFRWLFHALGLMCSYVFLWVCFGLFGRLIVFMREVWGSL